MATTSFPQKQIDFDRRDFESICHVICYLIRFREFIHIYEQITNWNINLCSFWIFFYYYFEEKLGFLILKNVDRKNGNLDSVRDILFDRSRALAHVLGQSAQWPRSGIYYSNKFTYFNAILYNRSKTRLEYLQN